ncbi:helicase domino-like isoform X2 [Brevipalpus obovatus]|uniref:helicase domino-like isoform X2 n=1 Tax=Brevipalpus obovatus TaxID=246614 RepID=UPI003D9F47D3
MNTATNSGGSIKMEKVDRDALEQPFSFSTTDTTTAAATTTTIDRACEQQPFCKRLKLSPEYDRDVIMDYLDNDYKRRRETYIDHVLELFFLEQQGNLMDYYSWRKKSPTFALLQYLKANIANSDDDFEHLQRLKASLDMSSGSSKSTPIVTVTELESAASHLGPTFPLSSVSSTTPLTSRPTSAPHVLIGSTTKSHIVNTSSPASQVSLPPLSPLSSLSSSSPSSKTINTTTTVTTNTVSSSVKPPSLTSDTAPTPFPKALSPASHPTSTTTTTTTTLTTITTATTTASITTTTTSTITPHPHDPKSPALGSLEKQNSNTAPTTETSLTSRTPVQITDLGSRTENITVHSSSRRSNVLGNSANNVSSIQPPPKANASFSVPNTLSPASLPSTPTMTTRKQSNKQHSLSSVYDMSIGSQEQIVERAKQEAYVMQRIAELRKEGLWSAKRLPKVQEPHRAKAHWDYLLEEMSWLATDFAQERKLKKTAARKCARMIMKYHQDKEMQAERAGKEEVLRLRRIAATISKEIRSFWTNVEKLVEYRQQTRLEEKRKKALDLHLNYIVGQTEKFSSWLAAGMTKGSSEAAGDSQDDASDEISTANLVDPSKSSIEADDDDFEPRKLSESDDEETIAKDEEEFGTEDRKNELDLLKKESDMPIEDLIPREAIKLSDPGENLEEETKDRELTSQDDDFKIDAEEDAEDDEETIAAEEKLAKNIDYASELKELEDEANLSVEELKERYKLALEEECPDAPSENGDSDETSGTIEDDSKMGESDDQTEDEDDLLTEDESESEELGMASLIEDDSPEKKPLIEVVSGDDKSDPSGAITDIAAGAESIKPKGFTLSTAQVVTKVPFLLKHKLREYQHIGLDWLVAMSDKKLNGILADEMGLGKTIQTISLLAHLAVEKGIWGPHLIVVPTSVMLNWEMEFKKWCPAFKILTYYGNPKERKLKRQGWTKPNKFHVCITSYKLVIQDHQAFRRKKWKYLILDEAQHIKNFKSLRWQMLLNFNSSRRLLLTGTPLQNNLMELWSLMHFLMPNVFASHRDFRDWFVNPVTGMIEGNHEYNESLIKRLHKLLRPFLLRRVKDEVEKQLPKKIEHVVRTRLSKRQRFLYEEFMSLAKTKETLASGSFLSVINVLMQLRKVCNHPDLFEPRPITSPFAMEGITYNTASLITTPLDYDPGRHVDLGSLNLKLIDFSNTLSAIAQHRITEFHAPVKLIEEIDSAPEPPPKIPKGKIRLQINVKTQQLPVSSISSQSFHLHSRTIPSVQIRPINNISVNRIPSPASQASFPSSRLLFLPAVNSGNPGVINVGDSNSPINITGSQANILKRLALTKQITTGPPGNSLSNQRMKIQIGKLVQTPTGQHILVNPVHSSLPHSIILPHNVNNNDHITLVKTCDKPNGEIHEAIPKPVETSSELELTTLQKRKRKERQDKLRRLGQINALRCSAFALYAPDLIQMSNITQHPSQICCDPFVNYSAFSTGQGYFHCMHGQQKTRRAADYFFYTNCLSKILKSPMDLVEGLSDTLDRFVFLVPKVSAPSIQMHVSHPSPWKVQAEKNLFDDLGRELSPKCDIFHPIVTNMRTQFPELRLIQYDCGKLQMLDKLLYELKQGGHRVLIFTQMSRMLDIFEQFLNYHGHTYLRLDGSTKIETRQALMERFNADKRIFCFILSTRSGGIGVNLTGADTVIFYDSDWNPSMDAQAQDRCHRIGQTRDVHIYRLISEKTVEENILQKARQKRLLGDVAIEGGNFTTAFFKRDTISELFGLANIEAGTDKPSIQEVITPMDTSPPLESPPQDEEPATENNQVLQQLEQALCTAEEDPDAAAARTARAEAQAELAEFDESIPLDSDSRDHEEKTPAEDELDKLIEQLTPIERYAMQFLESVQEPISTEQLKQAEEEIEAHKKEWELAHLKSLKEEEEKAAAASDSDPEDILTIPREESCQVYLTYNGMEQMPIWAPPTPPQDSNDYYVDYSMAFLYETSIVPESQLPPVHVPREPKRIKLDPALARNKQHKVRKDDVMNIPRSLFDKPSAAILKLRRELKIQKLKGLLVGGPDVQRLQKTLSTLGNNVNVPQPLTLAQQAAAGKATQIILQGLQIENQLNWSINEDWAILQVIQFHQELPLNLVVLSPGHIPNWDLVSDAVNSIALNFRAAKICRHHYESVILQREEGKLLHDPSPKKNKKISKQNSTNIPSSIVPPSNSPAAPPGQTQSPAPKSNQGRPMRTSHIFIQDGNTSFSQLYHTRFETIKQIANKKQPTLRSMFLNSIGKNTRHISLLNELGVNYDQPLTPIQIAANRAERERSAKEKKAPFQSEQQQAFPETQRQQLVRQKPQQHPQRSISSQLLQQTQAVVHQRPQILQPQAHVYGDRTQVQITSHQTSAPSQSIANSQQVPSSQAQILQLKQPAIKTVLTNQSITLQPSQANVQHGLQAKVTTLSQGPGTKSTATPGFVMTNFSSNQQTVNALNQFFATQSPQPNQPGSSLNTLLPQGARLTASSSGGTVTIPIAVQSIVPGSQSPVSVITSQASGNTVLSVTALPRSQNQKILAAAIIQPNQMTPQGKLPPALQQAFKQQFLIRQGQPRPHQQVLPVQQLQLQKPQQSQHASLASSAQASQQSEQPNVHSHSAPVQFVANPSQGSLMFDVQDVPDASDTSNVEKMDEM